MSNSTEPDIEPISPWEKRLLEDAKAVDSQEHQDSMVIEQPMPPEKGDIVEIDADKKTHLTITDVHDPVQAIAFMHPEFAQAAVKRGVDLTKPPGRELEQMRKYFGQGSGTYLVTVDFQLARTEAFKLDDRAQKKITKALKPKKKATKRKKRVTKRKNR
jgi:hypothetical protein